MPNKKQKQMMREEKRRRAIAEKESAELAANQFDEQHIRQLGHEADQLGVPVVPPKMSVKTRKRVKWKEWKLGESTNHLTKKES